MMTVTRKRLKPSHIVHMQSAMQEAPQSLSDLVVASGMSKPVVTRVVRNLQADGLVHVGGWGRDARGYPTIEKYSFGAGKDIMCPRKNESSTVRMASLRAKRKST
jgi:hypothetical protein